MSNNESSSNCRFCSVISQANGEDPIGSAGTPEHYLIIEAAPPWSGTIWLQADPMPQLVLDALNFVWERGVKIRQLAIAPDREYSQPGYTRILHYRKPAGLFAKFEKQEFIVPHDSVGAVAIALLKQPDQLPFFEKYRQLTSDIRELLICTHGNHDVACGRLGYPIYQQLRSKYASSGLRVWRCSHFGGHQFAPTLIDLPEGRYWGHLKPEILNLLVQRQGSVKELYSFYRGWAGLSSKFEQIAEREIWMQEGWNWLGYNKAGRVLASDQVDQQWANVRIDYITSDGSFKSAYQAKVELRGYTMTLRNSENDQPLEQVKQYHVSYLNQKAYL